jgi:hypothetical protein
MSAPPSNADVRHVPANPADGWIAVHCFVQSCEANELVSCSPSGPKLPEGWASVRIIVTQGDGPREWFACPQHIAECRGSTFRGLPSAPARGAAGVRPSLDLSRASSHG